MSILLALTATEPGEAARLYAIERAQETGESLVICPLDGSDPADFDFGGLAYTVETEVHRSRDAVGDLIDAVERVKPLFVVVGVRRRSPVGKMLLGSAAQRIILEANAPVVAVKPAN